VGPVHLIIEDPWWHSDTPHSVGLLWTSDQLDAESSTRQHTTLTTDKYPCQPAGFEPTIPASKRPQTHAYRSRGHWDGQNIITSMLKHPLFRHTYVHKMFNWNRQFVKEIKMKYGPENYSQNFKAYCGVK